MYLKKALELLTAYIKMITKESHEHFVKFLRMSLEYSMKQLT